MGAHPQYRPRRSALPRKSLLDPFKGLIVRWLDAHPLSAQQVFQRLRESGFTGGHTMHVIAEDLMDRSAWLGSLKAPARDFR